MYRLTIQKSALKALRKIPAKQAQRIRAELNKLAEDPNRADIDAKPLKGRPGFRLRIGEYRAIYNRDDAIQVIAILRVGPRGDIYS